MPYIQVQDIRQGMDRKRKQRVVGELGSAWTIKNGHLTRGGDIDRRKKFVKQTGSFPASTSGLYAINETLFTTGYLSADAAFVPPGVTHILTQHPSPATAIKKTLSAQGFDGTLYAIIEFIDGNIYHYYGDDRVTDWDTLASTIGSNNAIAAALANAIDNSSAVSASPSTNIITITSSTAGVPFTIAQNTVNNGSNADQTISLVEVQPNVSAVTEVLSKATVTITGGTSNPGVNRVASIMVDGVDVLGTPVNWATSNTATAAAVAAQINTTISSPNYSATSLGAIVTISALTGTGAVPNSFVVNVTEGGDVTTTHDATMSGGVTAVSAVAQVYTATIGGTFEPADQFTITINSTENYTVTGGASGTGTSILTFKQKLYSTAASNLYFSALNAPTQWIAGVDYGFINMASQTAGQETLTVAEEYQGLMAIFSENNIRIWSISEDSAANVFIQTLQNTGTLAPGSVIPYGNNDVFYLSASGIRSIKARDSSNAAYVSDVGTPIDTHIREYLNTLTQEEIRDAVGTVEPLDGRFWLGIKNRIYVLSYFPSAKISAWSYYEVDFTIKNFAKIGERIYVRGTDNDNVDYLYLHGGLDNNTYPAKDEDVCVIELPYFSAGDPAGNKKLLGFDIVGINSWNVDLLPDPNDEQVVVDLGIATGVTYGQPRFGVDGTTPLFALTLTCSEAGPATMSALAMHYDGPFDIG
jgi:hypothetical protein